MSDWIITIALVANVFVMACVCGELNDMKTKIGNVTQAKIEAHTQGWCDCLRCIDALKERKEE